MSGSWFAFRPYLVATMVYAGVRNVHLNFERYRRQEPVAPPVDDLARIFSAPLLWPCFVLHDHFLSVRVRPRYDNGE